MFALYRHHIKYRNSNLPSRTVKMPQGTQNCKVPSYSNIKIHKPSDNYTIRHTYDIDLLLYFASTSLYMAGYTSINKL